MAERGRPRGFDEEEVLDVAMRLFWEHGFDGTSMSELTEAMGINRRSIYAAFGNKEALFTAALDRYLAERGAYVAKAFALSTAREVAESFLRGSVDAFASSDCPSGCMLVQSALTCSDAAAAVHSDLAARRVAAEDAFRERFDRAQVDGDLPPDVDTQVLASYIVALSNGMSVQANSGVGRETLTRTVEFALSDLAECVMELADALSFVQGRHQGVVTTIRSSGRPQLSNIVYALGDDDVAPISVTDSRAKTKNLRRDPRASLYVVGDDFWSYVVLEGTAELTPKSADPADGTVDELVALYRAVAGEHSDWDEFRREMVADSRLVVRLHFDHAYGMVPTS